MTAEDELVQRLKPYRRALLAHCYRMLGSLDDAEDVVQETYLRAWRAVDTLADPAALRGWLYRIATNACLTALAQRKRRALPSGLGPPTADASAPIRRDDELAWLEPIPDALAVDPAALAASRQAIRLALVASFQYLPPRQRAILLLREVVALSTDEVAEALSMTPAAVKSQLQRARAQLAEVQPAARDVREPTDVEAQAILARYIDAFEGSRADALAELLTEDATLEMPPVLTWFAGKATCVPYLTARALGTRGDWRMTPTRANGQPAAIAYRRASDGAYRSFGIAVLTVRPEGLAGIALFSGANVVERFL